MFLMSDDPENVTSSLRPATATSATTFPVHGRTCSLRSASY